ncbi:MAG: hypothetical protein EOP61_10570 [Sphingomonadales bacterium]|nr:MAG: hypothetical protein EOP61_10570 [Sphingomonadales bacterium]
MPLLLAISALISAPIAADPRWHRIAGDEYSVFYVEASTIRNEGGIRTAMTLTANAQPSDSGAYNIIVAVEYNCAAGSYRDMLFNYLDNDGNVLRKEEAQSGPAFRTPKPGSFNDLMMRFVCSGEGGTRVDEPLGDADSWFASH